MLNPNLQSGTGRKPAPLEPPRPALLKPKRFYLPEVDGIRFVAFSLVWFHHYPVDPRMWLGGLKSNGWIGVDVFLILSSFLITSLLLMEQNASGSISLARFYSRRFLRIWPLLGLALFLNYALLPATNYLPGGFQNAALLHDLRYHGIPNLLLLGNWSVAVFGYLAYGFAAHLWTINLEEQFYLFWPLLMFFVVLQPRRLILWCGGLLLVAYLTRFYYVEAGFFHPALWVSTITRLDPVAWGGILALLYARRTTARANAKHRWGSALLTAIAFVASVTLLTFVLRGWTWLGPKAAPFPDVWYKLGLADFCIAVAIGCVLNASAIAAIFRLPPIVWLGKISFGLYVYHKFFTDSGASSKLRNVALHFSGGTPGTSAWVVGMLFNGLGLVAVSALSYYCFERWFLKLKERFETILSRPA
jgi:peptidoglycan/LPS O-acetylase OafA/YrhL